MSDGRAPKGGCKGKNGEWYRGGSFLPSTTNPKRGSQGKPKGGGRVMIAPGEWASPPEVGHYSIYSRVRALTTYDDISNVQLRLIDNIEEVAAYYELEVGFLQGLVDRWNSGERWWRPEVAAALPLGEDDQISPSI